MKKTLRIIQCVAIILFIIFDAITIFVVDYNWRLTRSKNVDRLSQGVDFVFSKIDYICMLASETNTVVQASLLDEKEMEEIDPILASDISSDISRYNSILGFSCEMLILFDDGKTAFNSLGRVSYSMLEEHFSSDDSNFSIYTENKAIYKDVEYEKIYKDADYDKNEQKENPQSVITFFVPNMLNYSSMRYVIVIYTDYFKSYVENYVSADSASVYYNEFCVYQGKNYNDNLSASVDVNSFSYKYSEAYPWWNVFVLSGLEFVFCLLVYVYVAQRVKEHYASVEGYLKKLRVLTNKTVSDKNEIGEISKQFEDLIMEFSGIESTEVRGADNEVLEVLSSYVKMLTMTKREMSESVRNGLIHFGVNANRRIRVIYTCDIIDMESIVGDVINLENAVVILGDYSNRLTCRYGMSRSYENLSYVSVAYREARIGYEIAILYDKESVRNDASITICERLPFDINEFSDSLVKAIVSQNIDAVNKKLGELKTTLTQSYYTPQLITDTIERLYKDLDGIEKLDTCMLKTDQTSIFDYLEDFNFAVNKIYDDLAVKRVDKSEYYFIRIKDYIDEHFTEKDLCLTVLAEKFNYSIAYISHMFSKYSQTTYIDYVNRKRINMAKELLVKTDMSVAGVADKCGVDNLVTFRRLFKKYENMLPTEYRSKEIAKTEE